MCDIRGFAEAERRWLTPPEPKETEFDTALQELKDEISYRLYSLREKANDMTTQYQSNKIIDELEEVVGLIEAFNMRHEWEE